MRTWALGSTSSAGREGGRRRRGWIPPTGNGRAGTVRHSGGAVMGAGPSPGQDSGREGGGRSGLDRHGAGRPHSCRPESPAVRLAQPADVSTVNIGCLHCFQHSYIQLKKLATEASLWLTTSRNQGPIAFYQVFLQCLVKYINVINCGNHSPASLFQGNY